MQKVKNKLNKAVNKSLSKNGWNLHEEEMPFAKRFYSSLIREQEDTEGVEDVDVSDAPVVDDGSKLTPQNFDDKVTGGAYKDALEDETDEAAFDVEGLDPSISTESIKKIKEWSGKLDQFAEFLNDPSDDSLHRLISDNDKPGSLLRGITRKASDSITRIAGEIEKLKEVLNGFIIMAPKKLRDSEQLQ